MRNIIKYIAVAAFLGGAAWVHPGAAVSGIGALVLLKLRIPADLVMVNEGDLFGPEPSEIE